MERLPGRALWVLMAMVVVWLSPSVVLAVTGACSTCHVMHASQAGVAKTPYEYLMTTNCLGCHTGDSTAAPNTSTNAPAVYVNNAGTELAGGNFKYVDTSGDSYGHNVVELTPSNPEGVVAKATPPGWKNGFVDNNGGQVGDNSVGGGWTAGKLSCSGVYGCHGLHTAAGSMTGAHHNNLNTGADGEATGTAGVVGDGYRFLSGIKGWEDDKYEFSVSAVNGTHNIYYSEARVADTVNSKQTMSYFCAECHGLFHSGAVAVDTEGTANASFASPWIRHPVDMKMDNSDEYAGYNAYRPDAPVGSSDVANNVTNVALDPDRIVMCLSCHQAHASAYPSALRWDYTTIIAGTGPNTNGCFACHTLKDGS